MATPQQHYGTGRRKSAVARVFLRPGKGDIQVNGKPVDEFFSRETGRMIVRQPLALANHLNTFDILVNVQGGGESGQAGAVRHGITRALIEYDADAQARAEARRDWSPATHAKSSERRSACTRRAGASNTPSANRRFHTTKRPPSGGFFVLRRRGCAYHRCLWASRRKIMIKLGLSAAPGTPGWSCCGC